MVSASGVMVVHPLREYSFLERGEGGGGGWAGRIPMSINVKPPSPPFLFFVKKCDPSPGSIKIYSDPTLPPGKNIVCGWIVQLSPVLHTEALVS